MSVCGQNSDGAGGGEGGPDSINGEASAHSSRVSTPVQNLVAAQVSVVLLLDVSLSVKLRSLLLIYCCVIGEAFSFVVYLLLGLQRWFDFCRAFPCFVLWLCCYQ